VLRRSFADIQITDRQNFNIKITDRKMHEEMVHPNLTNFFYSILPIPNLT
jgi:hypothetical protein